MELKPLHEACEITQNKRTHLPRPTHTSARLLARLFHTCAHSPISVPWSPPLSRPQRAEPVARRHPAQLRPTPPNSAARVGTYRDYSQTCLIDRYLEQPSAVALHIIHLFVVSAQSHPAMSTSRSVPPPSQAEVTRKLSVHSAARPSPPKKPSPAALPVSGTESDSDSVFSPETVSAPPVATASAVLSGNSSQPPLLSSIAERERETASGEESEEDEDDEEGNWRSADPMGDERADETVIKTGYLWKKGERRKTWKKRWFVLRPAHLAFYKTDAEYKLLRLLDLAEIHTCTPVALKKHAHTFGLVAPARTFYLQAASGAQAQEWVRAINATRGALLAAATPPERTAASSPVPIPAAPSRHAPGAGAGQGHAQVPFSPSQSPHGLHLTSSESDDASPGAGRPFPASPSPPHAQAHTGVSFSEQSPSKHAGKDAPKVVLSGYLMKCGSRRHNWHKRWFVLSGETLVYSRSHMDTKPHRQIPLAQVLDALEYELPPHRHTPAVGSPPAASPPHAPHAADDAADAAARTHTFKVVTTKRTLLLCAPSEEEEIRWLSAVRALLARRSGAGVVPGDARAPAAATAASPPRPAAPGVGAASGTGTGAGTSLGGEQPHGHAGVGPAAAGAAAGTGGRRNSFARRLSMGGGAAPASTVSAAPQEAVSGR
ncbi:hypothetical protein AcV5_008244 [Taiwanofungus camphoratus]|nr:hypothetical protein AcV5_008244 [Antrodia cinnamomea]